MEEQRNLNKVNVCLYVSLFLDCILSIKEEKDYK